MATENQRIGIVILAAGGSERLGSPKQLLFYKGTSLIRAMTREALNSRADKVAVVLGAKYEKIASEIVRQKITIVRNPDWEKGIGSSIREGVKHIQEGMDGILLAVTDQPLVTTPYLNSVIERFRESPSSIIASQYSGTLGVPALFPSSYFKELLTLPDDAGAKSVILRHLNEPIGPQSTTQQSATPRATDSRGRIPVGSGRPSSVIPIDFPDGSVDIDNLSDLKKLQ